MKFNCEDTEVGLMRVALFVKANNVVSGGFVVFPSFLFMQQQFQLFFTLPMYLVNV